ncbi:MAG: hypothetical protein FWG94_10555 [Oscillospiraceae bacterium]|nr:hypothetical protein [Oscillospiraceae bacterium]
MKNRAKRQIAVILALLIGLLSSCSNPAAMSEADSKTANELGHRFAEYISEGILQYREDPERLYSFGYVVYDGEKLLGADYLARFYIEYGDGLDAAITVVFSGGGFVVSRIIFSGGKGFYLRYEYDRLNPGDVAVTARLVDDVALRYTDDPPKWEMDLFFAGKQIAGFSFENPDS